MAAAPPAGPVDPYLDLPPDRVLSRKVVPGHLLIAAQRDGAVDWVIPAPRLLALNGPAGIRMRDRMLPGALMPVLEVYAVAKDGRTLYLTDYDTRTEPLPRGLVWRPAARMPNSRIRRAAVIMARRRCGPPSVWITDQDALAAGIAPFQVRLDNGRRVVRYGPWSVIQEPPGDPPMELLRSRPRHAFAADYQRRSGIGPWRWRECDVLRIRLVPYVAPVKITPYGENPLADDAAGDQGEATGTTG